MTWIDDVLDVIQDSQTITRNINKHNLRNHLTHALPSTPPVTEDEQEIQVTYGPRYTLLLIGAGETSTYLAQFASALDYQVYVADPREEMHALWNDENGTLLKMMPDDAVLHIQPNAYTSIITLTHDPKLDDMALLEALKSEAHFIGSLGSTRTNAKRRERLALFDLTQSQIDRLQGPVGLEIGSKTPAEIAVSIMAQLVLVNKSSNISQLVPKIRAVSNG
jgi:xanthine dehydrogenase accessory factor